LPVPLAAFLFEAVATAVNVFVLVVVVLCRTRRICFVRLLRIPAAVPAMCAVGALVALRALGAVNGIVLNFG